MSTTISYQRKPHVISSGVRHLLILTSPKNNVLWGRYPRLSPTAMKKNMKKVLGIPGSTLTGWINKHAEEDEYEIEKEKLEIICKKISLNCRPALEAKNQYPLERKFFEENGHHKLAELFDMDRRTADYIVDSYRFSVVSVAPVGFFHHKAPAGNAVEALIRRRFLCFRLGLSQKNSHKLHLIPLTISNDFSLGSFSHNKVYGIKCNFAIVTGGKKIQHEGFLSQCHSLLAIHSHDSANTSTRVLEFPFSTDTLADGYVTRCFFRGSTTDAKGFRLQSRRSLLVTLPEHDGKESDFLNLARIVNPQDKLPELDFPAKGGNLPKTYGDITKALCDWYEHPNSSLDVSPRILKELADTRRSIVWA